MPLRRIPSLNWLRVFEAAARSGSFSGAGKQLNMSAAAVSQQIKALETHLKTPLFERGARSVSLTETGAAFLPVVSQSLLSMETTAASLFGAAGTSPVTVRCSMIFATSFLAEQLGSFTNRHPDIQPHILGDADISDPDRTSTDLQIVYDTPPGSWGDKDMLFGETIYPVASPAMAQSTKKAGDLLKHRLIEISTHRTSWMQLLGQAGISDTGEARFCFVDSTEIAFALAANGYGVALARAPATDGIEARFGLQRCLRDQEVSGAQAYHLLYRSETSLTRPAARFREWLIEVTAPHRRTG